MASDSPVHSPEFRRRRAANWLALGLTYAAMYMARYNFSIANVDLQAKFGWSYSKVGIIISAGSLVYGISAIFNGPIADRFGGRRAMLIGAAGAAIFNFVFGLGAYIGVLGTGTVLLAYFATVWSLNMYFASYSALALIKVNSAWFHVNERGIFSAIFGGMIQSGRALVYGILGLAAVKALPWQWKFFIPGFIVSGMFVVTFLVVKDSPGKAGHTDFDTADATSGDTEKITLGYVARKVFTNPVAITIAIAELCTGVVRKGFEEWFPQYMVKVQGLALDNPVFTKNAMAIVVAGIAGAVAAGSISHYLFKNRRPPVAFLGYVIQVICLAIVWRAPSLTWVTVAFVANSFAISVVHSMLSGTASMDFGGKRAAATAAGMFDGMQYVGGFFAGWFLGSLIDAFGWGIWGPSLLGFSAIGAVLMLFLWNARPKRGGGGH